MCLTIEVDADQLNHTLESHWPFCIYTLAVTQIAVPREGLLLIEQVSARLSQQAFYD